MNVKVTVFAPFKCYRAIGRKFGVRVDVGAFTKLNYIFGAVIFYCVYSAVYSVISADFFAIVIKGYAVNVGIVLAVFG